MTATITTPHETLTATVHPDQADLAGTGYIRLIVDGDVLCWSAAVVTL